MAVLQRAVARTRAGVSRGREHGGRVVTAGAPMARWLGRAASPVSSLGWTVLAGGVGCWLLGWRFGWVELMLVATAAVALFVLCALLMIGRTRLRVDVEVEPQRVTVGTPAAGQVRVTNAARGVLLPIVLELPIGTGEARFNLPTLRGGGSHEELFVVPTERRGVIPIGPATTVRGDPLGLFRRAVQWTTKLELFVHPVTVPLEPVGAGLLRDLEGQTTNDLSMSDLAFHALRDYSPGDDRRYIHWRSSAKAGRFLVRQFLDTRRSHFTAVVDSDLRSYADPMDFETAISVGASVAVRALIDEQDLTVLAGAHALPSALGQRVLDTFSRAELADHGLRDLATRAARIAPDTSVALLITGSLVPFIDIHRAAAHFPPEVRSLAIRIDPGAPTSVRGSRGLTVLSLQSLAELPAALAGTLA
jgi:uncharacterized protein (DUF58 family)